MDEPKQGVFESRSEACFQQGAHPRNDLRLRGLTPTGQTKLRSRRSAAEQKKGTTTNTASSREQRTQMTLPSPPGMETSSNASTNESTPPSAGASTVSGAGAAAAINVVRLCGTTAAPCGYCNGDRAALVEETTPQDSSKSYGFLAVGPLQLQDYESLIERGWRRSGLHIYKPHNFMSCCPALTIRLPVNDFTPTKSQKRVIKKLNRLLRPQQEHNHTLHDAVQASDTATRNGRRRQRSSSASPSFVDSTLRSILTETTNIALKEITGHVHAGDLIQFRVLQQKRPRRQPPKVSEVHAVLRAVPAASTRTTWMTPVCAIIAGRSRGAIRRGELSKLLAAELERKLNQNNVVTKLGKMVVEAHEESGQVLVRIENARLPLLAKASSSTASDESSVAAMPKQCPIREEAEDDTMDISTSTIKTMDLSGKDAVSDLHSGTGLKSPYDFSIKTVPAAESALMPEVHQLFFEYQHSVHNDPHPAQEPPHDQDLDWGELPSEFRKEANAMLQRLYAQKLSPERQHGLACAFSSFCRFLVESPLPNTANEDGSVGNRVGGTFHQHYRIAGKLVAVGVVDVLRNGLSSVYVFYSPEWSRRVPLGKLAVLKEIEYTAKTLQLPYYYLGYYIESCGKMRYKADFAPSQLLCPTTYKWVDYVKAHATLLRDSPERHCCKLYDGDLADDETQRQRLIEGMPLDVGAGALVTLNMLQEQGQALIRPHVAEFVEQAGPAMSQRSVIRLV